MSSAETGPSVRIPLSRSQRNIYSGVLQDSDPQLYLIGRRYRFHPMDLPRMLAALDATIRANPIQLCMLEFDGDGQYPVLTPGVRAHELVRVCADDPADTAATLLSAGWIPDLLGVPLACYVVRVDDDGAACGLDAYCHHILLDGGGTGIIEDHLGRALAGVLDFCSVAEGFGALDRAHRQEAARIDSAQQRLAAVTARELEAEADDLGVHIGQAPGHAARGVLTGLVTIEGDHYNALLTLCDQHTVPLNVLLTAAAVAVDAGIRGRTDTLVVHAIDNRFGEPDLGVASCLVNSVAQAVRFPPFASVAELVSAVDRGYVKALRRRWLREEQYRRMHLAINRSTGVEALTLNFLATPCAPALRPFLAESPMTTDIGPIEGMTVAAVADEARERLQIAVWDRADLPQRAHRGVAERIAAALGSFAADWDRPAATTVGQWQVVTADGTVAPGEQAAPTPGRAAAWFTLSGSAAGLARRAYLNRWLAWLERAQLARGEVLVLTDDNTDRTVDLLLACHLAGCAYSPCETVEQSQLRADRIATAGFAVRIVDPADVELGTDVGVAPTGRVAERLAAVANDPALSRRTACIMPTSGTTGRPKLVHITHGALAAFCAGIGHAYGWTPSDTVLQCAPLTSDISVEEIFGAVCAGAGLIRSTATRTGDLPALCRDVLATRTTVLDLPTALWHLLCEDPDALGSISRSSLRQLIIGGEPVRSSAVDKWTQSSATAAISLISTYGPTETTVIVNYLPLTQADEPGAHRRLGRPLVPGSVYVAFGEIVVAGDLVAAGYLEHGADGFGTVLAADGTRWPAYATGDRVAITEGHPVFAGRRDALVKIAGRRIDTAALGRRIGADTEVTDLAVAVAAGALGVWFSTGRTRDGDGDPTVAARIRGILTAAAVPSFFVTAVPAIPRKPNGKIDRAALPEPPELTGFGNDPAGRDRADNLARLWSAALGRPLGPGSSLLDEGIGSLDLIKILPPTRQLLGWQLSIFDLIGADTAANLAAAVPTSAAALTPATIAEIEDDVRAFENRRAGPRVVAEPAPNRTDTIVVLGASGILGRGFAEAVLTARRAGTWLPEVVLAMRSAPPEEGPWAALSQTPGVQLVRMPTGFGPAELDALLCDSGATTLINCIGNANMLSPYADLRPANLDIVPVTIDACLRRSVSLVHLSTSVVVDDVCAAHVIDPRRAPYPYAAVKALAELVVTDAPAALDFTMVRLPRILGEPDQLADSNDILVSMVAACTALKARPRLSVSEEVTTGRAAAQAILDRLPVASSPVRFGRDITAVRGAVIEYQDLLAEFGTEELDLAEWKRRLDRSPWARQYPRRWSIIDAWLSLGARLNGRRYHEYLAECPSVDVDIRSVTPVDARPDSLPELLEHSIGDVAGTLLRQVTTEESKPCTSWERTAP